MRRDNDYRIPTLEAKLKQINSTKGDTMATKKASKTMPRDKRKWERRIAKQFQRWKNHKIAYINAMQKYLDRPTARPNKYLGKDAKLWFAWWVSRESINRFLGDKENTEIDL